jgi:hypothetical protein
MYSTIVATQRLGKKKRYRCNEYTRSNRKIIGRFVYCVVRVVSRRVGEQFFPELLVVIKLENGVISRNAVRFCTYAFITLPPVNTCRNVEGELEEIDVMHKVEDVLFLFLFWKKELELENCACVGPPVDPARVYPPASQTASVCRRQEPNRIFPCLKVSENISLDLELKFRAAEFPHVLFFVNGIVVT